MEMTLDEVIKGDLDAEYATVGPFQSVFLMVETCNTEIQTRMVGNGGD